MSQPALIVLFCLTAGMLGFRSFTAKTAALPAPTEQQAAGIRFSVGIDPKLVTTPATSGRVLVALRKEGSTGGRRRGSEPRFSIGSMGMDAPPFLGADADNFTADKQITLDANSAIFPIETLNKLPAGTYTAQAVLHSNRDLNLPDAPGNLYSQVETVELDPAKPSLVKLTLTERIPEEKVPADSANIKYLKFRSKLLSDFHKRPFFYRASVVLPPKFDSETDKKYLLRVHIGGYGSRYTFGGMMQPDPRFVQIMLDGAGPYGDPYQVNSDNNGPYGDALTQELIPHIEKLYRCGGEGKRFTDGGSTGGWVSFALQVFYPDYFNGCWSSCPDSVDFRAYELINIYEDKNAYVNRYGFERPAKRTIDGDCIYTVRHECQVENVIGRGDRWQLGGKDWCAWNATYGPRGEDGIPKPLWNPRTGEIDKSVLSHWEKYDLKKVLEKDWAKLGPKLTGKIHIWVGDADDYYLNNAVHRLKAMLNSRSNPKFEGEVTIAMRQPHTNGWSNGTMLNAMAERGK